MRYLLDSNTFIQAQNTYYGMDICPAFWDWLHLQAESGVVSSISLISDEMKDGKDDLVQWVKDRPNHFMSVDDEQTQAQFQAIAQYVYDGNYNAGNRDQFLAKADPWIIAKAKVLGAVVVTQEAKGGPGCKKVKIPNICEVFNVKCIRTHDLLRQLRAKFILDTASS